MTKRPAFQFYPGDWKRDTALRSCTVCARGLWIDMIAAMHDAEPYGHLSVNGRKIDDVALSRMVGAPLRQVQVWLAELEGAGVFSRTDAGTIYSRRMVRDEEIREKRAAGGVKGGNPALLQKDNPEVDGKVNLPANLQPTPAVAVAVAVQKKEKASLSQKKALPEDWEPNAEHRAEATRLGVDVNLEAEKMRDWAAANGERKVKWDAAFRNWLRNSKPSKAIANSKQGVTALDLRTLLFAGGEMVFNGFGYAAAVVTIAERHPDIWSRAGPVFEQLDFPSLARDRTNDFQLMRNLESQLATYRSNAA